MSSLNILVPIALSVLGWFAIRTLGTSKKKPYPIPPSPPADPIIGHVRTLLAAYGREDVVFHELGLKYGGIVYLNALGQGVVVLNDLSIAEELLDKRGSIYSSRLRVPLGEIMGLKQALPFMPYGDDFRLHRKLFQKYFRQERCAEHQPIELREARILLQNLAKTPNDWEAHLLRYATAIIIEISFGHTTSSSDDPYIKIADDVRHHVVPCLMNSDPVASGLALMFPFLQYMPSWFPGSHYPRLARRAMTYLDRFYTYPLQNVQAEMAAGVAKPSFMAEQIQELRDGEVESGVTLLHIQGAATMSYLGGMETTSSTLATLVAAMLLHPEHQQKVQAEIDAVVGTGRLPDFSDRNSLPCLERVLHEVQRWQPVIPIGIIPSLSNTYNFLIITTPAPHYLTEDDHYNGMYIPKGTLIVANIKGMNMDKSTYNDPSTFNPDRYLPKPEGYGEPYPATTWGFGRRVCPGRYLAEDSLWIASAHLLATMSIKKPKTSEGKTIQPDIKFVYGGSTSHPLPFHCRIEPRNDAICHLLNLAEFI